MSANMDTSADTRLSNEDTNTLILQLASDNSEGRLSALRSLHFIAESIGPERVHSELIEYLHGTVDDEDEVMAVMAEQIPTLLPFLNSSENTNKLLPLLEELASNEEAVVREKYFSDAVCIVSAQSIPCRKDGPTILCASLNPICKINCSFHMIHIKATTSLIHVAKHMSENALEESFVPMVGRFVSDHWYTRRASACALLPTLYVMLRSSEFRISIIQSLSQLCNDQAVMVRRAAAVALKDMFTCVKTEDAYPHLKQMYKTLAGDRQDSVRLLAVSVLPELGKIIQADEIVFQEMISDIKVFAQDAAWRVRYMLAETIVEIEKSIPLSLRTSDLLPIYVDLLKDAEAEIRRCAAGKVLEFALELDPTAKVPLVIHHLIPVVDLLSQDTNEHTRASLANVVMGLSPVVGREGTMSHLLPAFLRLLRDEVRHGPRSDSPLITCINSIIFTSSIIITLDLLKTCVTLLSTLHLSSQVRLNVISHLNEVNSVIGLSHLSEPLLRPIEHLATDSKWRVRLAIMEYFPTIAEQLGAEFFNLNLLSFCKRWLQDSIYAIRDAAVQMLCKLFRIFHEPWLLSLETLYDVFAPTYIFPDSAWGEENVLPALEELGKSTNHQHRLTLLFAIKALVPDVSPDLIAQKFVSLTVSLTRDKIPNIRINVAKTLKIVLERLKRTRHLRGEIKATLDELARDKDPDVSDYAREALTARKFLSAFN